ncbi:GGDEF domain-containing protein [Paenibacillus koleovorans]|uniref:GGDEF domain-containing protein n=1 Tax=Paenibacillus koleovorans TaxID=121608 RepID=UPI000FD7FAD3|nr:GGDEF domain-containing protein [Paenibacillus koleovorans]
MNFFLDSKTIFSTLGIGHFFSVILILAYWRQQAKDPSLQAFFMAKCTQTAAWLFQLLRGGIPEVVAVSVSNTILFVGVALEIIALLSLQNVLSERIKRFYLYYTALSIVGFVLILILNNQENIRIAFASLVTAVMIIPVYRVILGKDSTLLMKMMGGVYFLIVATSVARGGAALLNSPTVGLFTPGAYQTVSLLAVYLVMILGNTGFILLLKEKTDRELVRLASTDDLTGALNRRTFTAIGKQSLADHAGKRLPVSYMLFDIDRFKTINDTLGHSAGDQVLVDLTAQVRRVLGAKDLFVRYGGDEFGILLPGQSEAEADRMVERIRHALEGALGRGISVDYTISIGILTVIPDPNTQLETLYTTCDKALYVAKEQGRNRVHRIG